MFLMSKVCDLPLKLPNLSTKGPFDSVSPKPSTFWKFLSTEHTAFMN